MTTGSSTIAITAITFSAYGADDTLVTVRSLAEPRLETITRGYRLVNRDSTTVPMVTAAAVNAHPSRPAMASQTAASMATIAASSTTDSRAPPLPLMWVQMIVASTATAVTGAIRR